MNQQVACHTLSEWEGDTFRHDWSIRHKGSLFAWGRAHCCGVIGDTQKRAKMGGRTQAGFERRVRKLWGVWGGGGGGLEFEQATPLGFAGSLAESHKSIPIAVGEADSSGQWGFFVGGNPTVGKAGVPLDKGNEGLDYWQQTYRGYGMHRGCRMLGPHVLGHKKEEGAYNAYPTEDQNAHQCAHDRWCCHEQRTVSLETWISAIPPSRQCTMEKATMRQCLTDRGLDSIGR